MQCLSFGLLVADHLCAPIDHLPRAGELVLTGELPLAIGGCAANAAIDLARLGVTVGVAGCVGDDPFGRFITDALHRHGVDTRWIRQSLEAPTSGTLIINVAGEDRRFVHCIGANAQLSADDLPDAALEQCKVLYVGGYLLTPGVDPQALARVFARARRMGVLTVLDIVLPGPGDHWPRLAPVLAETDAFLPNTDEAAIITGLADPLAQAEAFAAAGVKTAVITCGAAGSWLIGHGARLFAPSYPAEYVGGTGAGDAFDAGYIAALLEGGAPEDCLRWGSALGASCVRAVGATESVFTRIEAETFLRSHPLELRKV